VYEARGMVEVWAPTDLRSNLPDFALLQNGAAAASDMVSDDGPGAVVGPALFEY
jgi:hypothetical protein